MQLSRISSCPSPLEFRCPVPFLLTPDYYCLRRTSFLRQSILKFSNEASASLSFRVMCSFHNQLLCDVTTEEQSKQKESLSWKGAKEF